MNALIHTDYSAPGNIVIESKTDTFRFTNPGTLLVTLTQYYTGGISECRNISLQKMFLMIGSAEKAGSGVGKIMSGWENAHWRTPYLTVDNNPDRLVLELPMFSIIPNETLNELQSLFGDSVNTLPKDELTILAACHIEGDITNRRLQYMIDRHKTDITKILQDLCRSGFLISENKNRWTTYHLNSEFLNNNIIVIDGTETNLDGSEANLDGSGANLDGSETNLDGSEANLDSKNSVNEIPKKISKERMFEIIQQLCKDTYLSTEDIATRVGRSTEYLKNDIIPKMIENELLVRLYPENLYHPQQKFKTK